MPQSTQKRTRNTTWIPLVIAVAVLIGTATWVGALLPTDNEKTMRVQPDAVTTTTLPAYPKLLKEWEGMVALFANGGEQPLTVYEVNVRSLPTEEQERLKVGIAVDSEEMLTEILENYTS